MADINLRDMRVDYAWMGGTIAWPEHEVVGTLVETISHGFVVKTSDDCGRQALPEEILNWIGPASPWWYSEPSRRRGMTKKAQEAFYNKLRQALGFVKLPKSRLPKPLEPDGFDKPCPYCHLPFDHQDTDDPRATYTNQHVLPKRRGGGNHKQNLRPCCWGCNQDLNHPLIDDCPGALAVFRSIHCIRRGNLAHFVKTQEYTRT